MQYAPAKPSILCLEQFWWMHRSHKRNYIETEAVIKIELVSNNDTGAHINAVSDRHLLCMTLYCSEVAFSGI